ncbi:Chromatin modification-related protein [Mycena indigotica]|uniref:Chromatin modification-related protein n=1 Tax=Mycena indigotica TaxID=2126181 RepID=A0A8H6W6D5_9AGAR|nr:Chromatin modification-related protein [Mycena indigotica]KAF7306572.1 Chromatin modification-related protein [Mycena indigotica]
MSALLSTQQNLEDASTLVSEFIYSLDNIPNEVAHLLQEIKELDTKVQDLQQEIDKDSARYIRHSLKASNSASSSLANSPSPVSNLPRPPSPKSQAIPPKIAKAYEEIHALSAEKVALAQRIIDLVTRTRARLDAELTKVRILQGEPPDPLARSNSLVAAPLDGEVYIGASRNPVGYAETQRNPLASSTSSVDIRQQAVATSVSAASASAQPPLKKRRVTTQTSTPVKLAPVTPVQTPRRSQSPLTSGVHANAAAAQPKRSRLSRQIHPREDLDLDAEGEEEGEGEGDGDGEDENLYCFCQKQSYGDMIACDNDDCPYEWFHLSCVQLTQPTPEKWYCKECIDKGFGPGGRKGRKR